MSNVTAVRFGKDGGVIMADSVAMKPSEDNLYRHSKLFKVGNSAVGFVGSASDAEPSIEECMRSYSNKTVDKLADRIRDLSNERRKREFEEMYLKPKGLSFKSITKDLYDDYVKNPFFQATFILLGFGEDGAKIYMVDRLDEAAYSPSYMSYEAGEFLSYGCGDEIVSNALCNYINRRGYPTDKKETYGLLLFAFSKINIKEHISRPYDVFISENGVTRNIPRELNELNAKLLELTERSIVDKKILEDSMEATVRYAPFGSVISLVLEDLRGKESEIITSLLSVPRV